MSARPLDLAIDTPPNALDRVRSQLQRVDRLAGFGTLAAGIGHELNNLATLVQGVMAEISDSVAEGRTPVSDVEEDLQVIFDHLVLHGRQLTQAGRETGERLERVDLRGLVGATLDMLHNAGKTKYVKVERDFTDLPVDLALVRARIEQVVINLVSNAVDAVVMDASHGKLIQVRIWREGPDHGALLISDDGPGVPEDLREAIFAPYFTTKAPRGTGLGLAVARQIAESLGGTLTLEPTPDILPAGAPRGARFKLRLPLNSAG